ncbi:MAG: flgG [Bacilli bacterium]|nr:flgG [Bacilli bacterium]
MLRSLYSGVSGMRGFQTKLDVIGNNIANVNTTGFKMGRVMFKDILSQTVGGVTAPDGLNQGGVNAKQIGLGSAIGSVDTIFTPGSAQTTNNPTDLRIDGDGFFAIKSNLDATVPFLTRDGNFKIDANRDLVTADGMFVMGANDSGKITLPDTVTAFTIGQDGKIIGVDNTGTSTDTGLQIGLLKVTNPSALEKIGGNLYRTNSNADANATPATIAPNDTTLGTGAIISGQLEMSNVDLTSEFTEMIIAQRGFQSNSRIITTSDEILQEIVNLKH